MKRKVNIIVLGLIAMFTLALDFIIWIKYTPLIVLPT